MHLPSISLDASPARDLQAEPAGAPPGAEVGNDRFSDRLARAMDRRAEGQNLAADHVGLKTLALGPGMEVITPGAEQPDAERLAAFATAQGLDPEVVAWLFGHDRRGAKPASEADPLDPSLQLAPGVALAATLVTPSLGTGWLEESTAGQASSSGAAVAEVIAEASSAASSLAMAQNLAKAGLEAKALATGQTEKAAMTGQDTMAVEILALEVDPLVEALLSDPAATVAGVEEAAADTHAGPAAMTGTVPATVPANAPAPTGSTPPAGTEATPGSAAQQRAEVLRDLSQRLGEAVGQRVLGQLARGNWSMKLLLKPSMLGDVEVDLRMRAGELDAAFRTLNPLTRELLNNGLPQLREVLTSAGMDIAGLQVGHGSSQGAGGYPTPREAMGQGRRTEQSDGAIMPATVTGASVAPRRSGNANWDVLV